MYFFLSFYICQPFTLVAIYSFSFHGEMAIAQEERNGKANGERGRKG